MEEKLSARLSALRRRRAALMEVIAALEDYERAAALSPRAALAASRPRARRGAGHRHSCRSRCGGAEGR